MCYLIDPLNTDTQICLFYGHCIVIESRVKYLDSGLGSGALGCWECGALQNLSDTPQVHTQLNVKSSRATLKMILFNSMQSIIITFDSSTMTGSQN